MKKIKKLCFSKKAQLGMIEFKFFFVGLVIAIIVAIVVIYLANKGILPFSMDFLCSAPAK